MNLLLLNRNFEMPADDWFHVVPLGEFPHPSGVTQVIDPKAATLIVEDFKHRAQTENFPGLLVDFDHFSSDSEKPSEAAGWITDLGNRPTGVYAKIRWSDTGEAAVRGGRYRLVSPVFSSKEVEDLKNRRLRVKRLLSVALTNDPNLRGMIPLSNRQDSGESPADTKPTSTQGTTMQKLKELLGLSADATEEDVIAAVVKLQQSIGQATAQAEAMQNRNTTLEAEAKKLREAQADADIASLGNQLKPDAKADVRNRLIADRDGTLALFNAMEPATAAGSGRLLNRAETKPPGSDRSSPNVGDLVQDYKNRHKCSFEQAWAAVKADKPELFKS